MRSIRLRNALLALIVPLALALLWEWAARTRAINPLFFPPPSAIAQQWWRLLRYKRFGHDIQASMVRLFAGFVLGAVPGVIVGMMMGLARPIRAALLPTITALYPVPRIAVLPLVLVVFGIGESGKLFMVAFSVFFLMALQTLDGVRRIDPVMLDVARSVRASRLKQYLSVAWPGALPSIVSGARLALGFALIVVVGTEFLASRDGVGARLWRAYQVLDVETLWAGIITTALLGWALNLLIGLVERVAMPWRRGLGDGS